MAAETKPRGFLDSAVFARLATIPLLSRRAVIGTISGIHASPHRGSSVEFAEYRRYVPGDDPRRLDWRAFGRSDRYYVKEFEADTNLRCCLVLDTSGSMNFGSTGQTRLEYARCLAATLASLVVRQGDAIGLTCVSETISRTIPPRGTPSHLREIFDLLEQTQAAGQTGFAGSLHELAETIPQRAMVILLSDFLAPPEEFKTAFEHLRFRKHDVVVFHLLDPQELTFSFQRPTRFQGLEGELQILADPQDIAVRYHIALEEYLAGMKAIARGAGVDYQFVRTDRAYESVLQDFLTARIRGGGRR
ncbi:MAG: DUF58 domain-containing protein [Planctomycetaceae bacterium]